MRLSRRGVQTFVRERQRELVLTRGCLVALSAAVMLFVRADFTPASRYENVQSQLISVLGNGGIVVIIALPFILLLILDTLSLWADRRSENLPAEVALALLTAFDSVVAAKTERFHRYSGDGGTDPFMVITQPTEQIRELVANLYVTFRTLTKDDDIRLVLAEVDGDRLTGVMYNAPQYAIPAISDEDLNAGTFLHYVLTERGPAYLTDLSKEKSDQHRNPLRDKRFLFLGEDGEDRGGIIGFPIQRYRHRKTTIFVLSIRSEVHRCDKEFLKQSKFIVEKFARRIQMESELARIRRTQEAIIAEGHTQGSQHSQKGA